MFDSWSTLYSIYGMFYTLTEKKTTWTSREWKSGVRRTPCPEKSSLYPLTLTISLAVLPIHTQNASLHYLVKYKFSKIAPSKAQQRQTRRAWTKENAIVDGRWAGTRPDTNSSFNKLHQVAQTGVVWIIFFHSDLGLTCLNRRLL